MKRFSKIIAFFLIAISVFMLGACSKKDPNPDPGLDIPSGEGVETPLIPINPNN